MADTAPLFDCVTWTVVPLGKSSAITPLPSGAAKTGSLDDVVEAELPQAPAPLAAAA